MKSRPRPAPRRTRLPGAGGAVPGLPAPPWWRRPAPWVALAALLLYLPTLGHALAWDDRDLIERNRLFHAGAPLARLLLSDFWAGSGITSGFWRPLITLSYWLDLRLFHGAPAGFHAMNLLAHAGTSALVALIAESAGAGALAALLAGLWFAWLPAHVESVSLVSGRTDLYGAAFFLLAWALDARARAAGARRPSWGALAALALALLSKEAAVVFVPLTALAVWIEDRGPGAAGRVLRWIAPYLAVTLVYGIAHLLVAPATGAMSGVDPLMGARVRAGTGLEFPAHLAFLWPWVSHAPGAVLRLPQHFGEPAVIASLLFQLLFVALLAGLALRRSRLAVPLALVWLPMVPLTWAGLVNGRLLFAERFAYLPSAAVAWLLAIGLGALLSRARTADAPRSLRAAAWIGVGLAGALTLGGAIEGVRALPMWRNDEAVFGSMVAKHPENPVGHAVIARMRVSEGRLDAAEAEVQRSLALDDRLALAHTAQAWIALDRGRWQDAIAAADRALAEDSSQAEARLVRGKALMETGRRAEARAMLEPLAEADPDNFGIAAEWGRWLMLEGRPAEALPFLARALVSPIYDGNAELHYELGLARAQTRSLPEARAEFTRAVTLDPGHYDAWLRLALVSHVLGDTAARDRALARAALLPQSSDGRLETLRHQLARVPSRAPR